jgi:hypothetical protein
MMTKPVSTKAIVEAAINSYNEQFEIAEREKRQQKLAEKKAFKEAENLYSMKAAALEKKARITSWSESVTTALLGDTIYHVFKNAMNESLLQQPNVTGMMRAMVSDLITEDANEILAKMRRKTPVLCEMYNLITDTRKKILESAAGEEHTFYIKQDLQDDFYSQLDSMDTSEIEDSIRERVSDAVNTFLDDNREDHDKIMEVLALTKAKVDEHEKEPEEVKESFQQMSRRAIAKIRDRRKGVFESMVTAMCESVLKHDNLKEEFCEGANLNIPKIVDRMQVMYTFIETVNTMQLYKIDEAYMQDLIDNLRK